jgi:RNA polymerase sigma-70 factor (ECF subfamily)
MMTDHPWLLPMPDSRTIAQPSDDPAQAIVDRESVRLAFVAALQFLPARQRAVLILCEVMSWPADEAATLLDTTVASVNSALQRARATMATRDLDTLRPLSPMDEQQELLSSFVAAFEAYDIDRLATLLRDDVVQSMPPFAMWIQGPADIAKFMKGPGAECRGSRMVPVGEVNGCATYAQYRKADTFGDDRGGHLPWAIHLIEVTQDESGPGIAALHTFLGPELFAEFGLPDHLPAEH